MRLRAHLHLSLLSSGSASPLGLAYLSGHMPLALRSLEVLREVLTRSRVSPAVSVAVAGTQVVVAPRVPVRTRV